LAGTDSPADQSDAVPAAVHVAKLEHVPPAQLALVSQWCPGRPPPVHTPFDLVSKVVKFFGG
jgi:hypothetical protein